LKVLGVLGLSDSIRVSDAFPKTQISLSTLICFDSSQDTFFMLRENYFTSIIVWIKFNK
jgi:hypothetical protein